ncbi:MAG: hypothetical protein QXV17_04990 [Candidatus Micrarchaeaceae archaeon]
MNLVQTMVQLGINRRTALKMVGFDDIEIREMLMPDDNNENNTGET